MVLVFTVEKIEAFGKRLFLPPALFANAHLLLSKLRFAAELKNKHALCARGLELCQNLRLSQGSQLCLRTELLLNYQQPVVFRHTIAAAERTSLNLACVGGYR